MGDLVRLRDWDWRPRTLSASEQSGHRHPALPEQMRPSESRAQWEPPGPLSGTPALWPFESRAHWQLSGPRGLQSASNREATGTPALPEQTRPSGPTLGIPGPPTLCVLCFLCFSFVPQSHALQSLQPILF